MLYRPTQRDRFMALLQEYGPRIRDLFLALIARLAGQVPFGLLVKKLEQRDIAGAVQALGFTPPVFNQVLDEVTAAYNAGGNGIIGDLPPLKMPSGFPVSIVFDIRNPVAVQWLRDHGASLITNIIADQMQMVRSALASGQERGLNPRSTALDIVGRKNAVGQREGGLIGLTEQQSGYVANARAELLSSDPAIMSNYLTRARRDRRFDASVRAAIEAGKPLPANAVQKIVSRYSDGLLKLRGETIGRTETLAALNASRDEGMRQTIASGAIDAALVDAKWNTIMDGRERLSHAAMNGQVRGWGQSFVSGFGNVLKHPGDPGAPISETANCRCSLTYTIRKRTVH